MLPVFCPPLLPALSTVLVLQGDFRIVGAPSMFLDVLRSFNKQKCVHAIMTSFASSWNPSITMYFLWIWSPLCLFHCPAACSFVISRVSALFHCLRDLLILETPRVSFDLRHRQVQLVNVRLAFFSFIIFSFYILGMHRFYFWWWGSCLKEESNSTHIS